MAAKYQQTYTMNAGIQVLCNIIQSKAFADKLRTEIKSVNPTPTGVWYRIHHGASFTSWGEKITITLTMLGEAMTQVNIHSECGMPTQVIDWGKNKQVVCNVYEYLEASIKNYSEHQQMGVPICVPADKAYCPKCGAPVPIRANFCQACGSKLH